MAPTFLLQKTPRLREASPGLIESGEGYQEVGAGGTVGLGLEK